MKKYPKIDKSLEIYNKAKKIMHPVSQTLAKAPGQFSEGVCPIYLDRAKGNIVWDVDGNKFLDYYAAIGPISLGYCYEKVDNAIIDQLRKGITFSLMHKLEYEVCDLISNIIPNAESVRISKSGADVCSAAVRAARAYTKRDKILCCGYHGWHDWYIGTTTRNYGIPNEVSKQTESFIYNDLSDLEEKLDSTVAAVIMEPFIFDKPNDNYLKEVKKLCEKNGTLLIFDEMWSGFRISVGGAQEFFDVKADLAVFSKAVANGMPIAFLTGRKDVMKVFENDVFFFTTFGGEALSMAATIATIRELQNKDVPGHLFKLGKLLKNGLNKLIKKHDLESYMFCHGFECRTILNLTNKISNPLEVYAYIQQELVRQGILWSKFHNITLAFNEEDISFTLDCYENIFLELKTILKSPNFNDHLIGKPLDVVFRKTSFSEK